MCIISKVTYANDCCQQCRLFMDLHFTPRQHQTPEDIFIDALFPKEKPELPVQLS